jgi:hypothetical protein
MVTAEKIALPYVFRKPIHRLKESDLRPTTRPPESWEDISADPAKGIMYGVLMGSLLWAAILLLVYVLL